MGFANVPGFGAKYRGEWDRVPPRESRKAPAQDNTGARVLARGRYLRKSRKNPQARIFCAFCHCMGI